MYKSIVLAASAAAVQAGIIATPYGSAPLAAPGYALNAAPLAAHGYALNAAPLAAQGYALNAAPLAAQGYALPAVAAQGYALNTAPLAAPQYAPQYSGLTYGAAPVAAAPQAYALPPVKNIQEAPIVEQVVEPVEQHGYSVRY
ncbi:hypothetical protein TCAL_17272 [Tigriopus californicus]|uniref:Uncharacterized protein n=1 Tax=Tigriopus californicus TaxID=6832 RepID=A0A553NXM1_TIGCA|nr:cuticle protein 38-like [Tigriopus californicus]TRY70185.1 hypothetical protein TCAL_17272 [Tigriopus californicus]